MIASVLSAVFLILLALAVGFKYGVAVGYKAHMDEAEMYARALAESEALKQHRKKQQEHYENMRAELRRSCS